jgi:hypothetical protein
VKTAPTDRCRQDTAACEAVGVGPVHVSGPPGRFEPANEPGAGVELMGVDAVAGAGGVGVVQVVPAVTHGDDRQRSDVTGMVTGW